MRTSVLLFASAAALGLTLGPMATALAQQPEGWYVEGAGGVNWMEDMDFAIEDPGDPDEVFSTEYDTGFAVSGRVGYAFGNGFRVDGEVAYRQNDFDTINIDGESVGSPAYDGDVSSWAFMLNGLYDISTGTSLTPYVGVGVGAVIVDFDGNLEGTSLSGDDTVFAAQGIAGLAYEFSPNLSAIVDYRYLRGFDVDAQVAQDGGETGFYRDDYANHTVMAGLRYTFVPPPAPPPAPVVVAPVAETAFIVFFDWDRADLTPEANLVLDDVVVVANQSGYASVRLDGYTDLSGSAQYNLGLSERRANSVANGLIARGIAPDEIVIRAFGEENPLVPTPDGVREPQNRRVEIFLI